VHLRFVVTGLFVGMVGFVGGVHAESKAILGPGAGTCTTWNQARKVERFPIQFSWVLGFVSSYNHYKSKNVFPDGSPETISNWIDVYCAKKPLSTLYDASVGLINELDRSNPDKPELKKDE
jgi:hypothetical protein